MIIMIAGKKGSGKDFVANLLRGKLRGYTEIEKFAQPLKRIITILTGYDSDDIESLKRIDRRFHVGLKEYNMRELMQTLATECIRDTFSKDIFSEYMLRKIKRNENTIISDWRFVNEYELIKNNTEQSVYTILVKEPEEDDSDKHISENDLNDFNFDFIFYNDKKKPLIEVDIDLLAVYNKIKGSESEKE